MAAKKGTTRKTTGTKSNQRKSTARKTPNKNTKAYQKQRELEIEEAKTPPENLIEIYAIICFAVNLILVLGTYGVCGKFGKMLSGFFFGLFGATFYVVPFVFFIAYCFLLVNGPKLKIIKKLTWITVLVMTAGFICQLTAGTKGVTIKDLYLDGYTDHRGGGIVFGGLIVLIALLISRAGAIIISVLLSIIAIIEITNVKLVDIFKSIFSFNFSNVNRYEEDYEEYDEDDEFEDEYDDVIISRDSAARDILGNIRVLDKSGKSAGAGKSKGKKKTNAIVPDEEIHEIIPQAETKKSRGGASKKYLSEAQSDLVMPGETRPRRNVTNAGNELLDEINSANAFYNAQKPSDTIAPNYKPKDFFELEPDSRTYEDPLGSDTLYSDESGKVEEEYKGPAKKKSESMRDSSLKELTPEPGKAFSKAVGSKTPEPAADEEPEKVTKQDKMEATKEIGKEIAANQEPKKKYVFPPMKLLKSGGRSAYNRTGDATVRETAITLKSTLESFGVNVTITNCSVGPAITRYELQPEQGVRVNKILSLENDIKLALAATDIRIEAPIPGKSSIGIEIPNKENQAVYFRDLIDNDVFSRFKSNLAFAVGKDISGQIIITDIAKMPHVLIAGQTGSGKSVCINTLIMSILYKSAPEDVKLIMIDPKMVELAVYNGIPHLLIPVVTDPKKAAGALNWAVEEMTKRYQLFSNYSVRNLEGFNKKVKELGPNDDPMFRHMPQIIVIVDELADLMMVAHKEVEDSIVRLSQLARAAGIHLVIATQRPSVDVITGLIKANVPSRIAFSVSSQVDSRTILDMAGAEKLLGKGDMLFYPTGYTKPVRVQGAFIDDDEVSAVVDFIKSNYGETTYDNSITQSIDSTSVGGNASAGAGAEEDSRYDEYFTDAARFVIEKDKASIGYLQRMLRIGFNRAARIMDQLEEFGVVGPEEGTKPRRILMTITEFEERIDSMG